MITPSSMKLSQFSARGIDGKDVALQTYEGKVVLVVNVASKCGYTPQYKGLEDLYQRYKDRGLVILGFPCNQFGAQEPGKESEIQSFCEMNYGVTFPLFAKVDVNGSDTHPLWAWLKGASPGILGTELIKWNFTKFLIARDGMTVTRFAPADTPESLAPAIEALL